jgi:hypothetical protein
MLKASNLWLWPALFNHPGIVIQRAPDRYSFDRNTQYR